VATDDPEQETSADELTDELARKYDPERLLKIISQRAGRGAPLDHSVRARYERRFGVDLGHVRIITGEFAEEFNRQRSAYAVTIGSTGMILMGNSPDKSPASAAGQALLGHELTHVAQQARHAGGGLHRKSTFSGGMPFAAEHEDEAEEMEQAILQEEAGAATAATAAQDAAESSRMAAAAARLAEQIEKIKARVIELVGDSARNQYLRNGAARRA
jgi:hypothetical protein